MQTTHSAHVKHPYSMHMENAISPHEAVFRELATPAKCVSPAALPLQIACATELELRQLSEKASFTPYYHAVVMAEIGRRSAQ